MDYSVMNRKRKALKPGLKKRIEYKNEYSEDACVDDEIRVMGFPERTGY